jgi:hypothetical protein
MGVRVDTMQIQFGFAFTGLGLVILLLILAIYGGARIRRRNPSLLRRYIAIIVIVGIVVPMAFIVVINLPPAREIELDITVDFKSNSTADESTFQYHWDAPGILSDALGIRINWRERYGESRSNGTGALYDLLENRGVSDFDIQWAEFEPFANETWTLLLNFYVGTAFDGQIMLKGDNESMNVENYGFTNDHYSDILLDGLDSLGVKGLEIYMDISLKISAQVLRRCFQVKAIDAQILMDLQLIVNDIEFGVISR